MSRDVPGAPRFFATALEFRAWLEANGHEATELVVGFWKVDSGRPSMTWPESVDEALCFGWIDGVRQRIDDEAYRIRFTPRKPGSIWSAINIAKVEALAAQGRMRPAGEAAFARRREHRSAVYTYERDEVFEFSADELRAFRADKPAWAWFQACAPGYRRQATAWVVGARRDETRQRRFAKLLDCCRAGEKLPQYRY